MPVENDTSHQNGQQDAGGGGGNGNVPTETSSQPQQAPEPNATIVNGTHAKVSDAPEDQLAKDAPKDAKKSDGSASFLRAARAGNLEKVLEFLKTNTDINTCNANGLNALHLASKEGHVNVVRELLQRGANVDAATKKGNTALHIASLAGQEEIVKVLVQHQALVNIQSQNGFTPLYMAAQENHDSVVRFLLANNANQSLATEDGFTPLAVALQQGHDKVVAVLLENDTRGKVRLPALHIAAKKDDTKAAALLLHTDHNPDVTSKSGFTPLHIASHYGNENIANLLIQRGADVNYIAKHQITPLHVASKWGKGNMVSLLIDKGANYEAKTRDGLTPLHCAARSGHEAVVDMLLEKGAPITSKTKNGLAPLHMASQGDHVDAARILLYHKAPVDDVTVDFLTALHVAAHCGHVRVAKLLLDRKAEANARALNGFTPLHIACKKNRIKVVELLLKHGASIEATTESGLTPLHVASFMGCMNIVIYLLQHSATADVPTVRGETPLHLAARANQTDIIRILLRNGAQVDARAREQQTALHIASRLGNSDIVVLLLQHGAAVDATTKDHYTALHIAAKEGQEEVASVLLEHGASLTSTTKKGFTPLHLAAKYGNMKVARLLLQKDALVDAQGKNGVTPLHVAAHYDHQNVALLLLDKGASPHATAKNGYTPLHIAARKNQMDIATTLLEYGASANAESKAGFTPLHLSSQEGHTDMATLLIEHNAAPGACAKNGLTPLHLCGQEDRVNVAAILVKHGAQIDPVTKAGYTPLHVACHFGQMNMVRFLLQHGAKVNSTTQLGYTPLHQAAQQGHTQIVNLLLENKAEPNTETNDGKTALSIAQRLGYISVVETLKIVTETTINTTTTTTTEEKYKVVVPETMHETFMSESEDEGGDDTMVSSMFGKPQHVTLPYYEGQFRYTSDDTMLGDQSYRYLTVDEMKSLGDDSLPIDVTKDEKMDMSFSSNQMAAPPVAPADHLSPQHQKEHYAQMTASYPADNVDVGKTPILAGPESLNTTLNTTIDSAMIEAQIEPQIIQTKLAPQQMVENSTDLANSGSVSEKAAEILNGWEGFLVSFMVDARGGAMRGCRHSGVRVIIPPRKAAMPMRVTCRYLKKDKLVHAPPLMEGEALASRILEMGPAGAKFLGPVIIEVPHFASLRGKEREIVILRSDNGETWREHTLEATEEAVQEVLNESFDGEELKQLEDLNTNRITRILTTDFPQYFAIVTRIRQEVHAIGPEGGMVSSTVVPQVQAVFPQGALTKKIKVGLQAQPIPTDLVAKLLGNRVAVSPIVTVEPRRRKFHKPITLTIPVPQASSKGMINQYSGEAPTLRLLCSITGGTTRAQWEDVTGSTPLTFVNDCVSFTTTVSARFWLMDCSNIPEATKMATELYREAIHVPFMAKFVVFSKRHQLEEARMRVFCMTDDREDKTLEHQELFVEVAKSRDVEVLEGKPQFLEFAGNLVPVTKSGDQLAFNFYAFRENRLPFTVRVKDQHADPIGRVAFMRQPKVGRGDPPQTPICNLNIALPDNIQPEPAPSEPDLLALEKKYSFLSISKADTIHRANLRLTDISNMLGTDWVALAHELEVTDSDINIIKSQYPDNAPQQAIVMLRLWMQTAGNKASGNTVGKALRKINREDIVKQCIFNVEVVTDDIERAMAKAHFDQSGFDTFKDELGPSRDATLNRDVSLDVSYDEQDMMKEAESAEEEEENQRAYHDKSSREQHTADLSPTYESEEKKYAGEEKVVTDEKVTKEEAADDSTTFTSFTATSTPIKKDTKEEEKLEAEKKDKASKPTQIVPDTLQESKEQTTVTDKDAKKPAEESVTKESISKEQPESVEKGKPATIVKEEIKEKEIDTTPVVKEKVELEEKKKEDEKPEASQKEPEKTVTSTTKTEVVGGPGDVTTVTTETKSYTTADDGSVQEHIVVKKQTTKVVDGKEMEEDKSAILQKLGEELGKLDEQLEEKFKKRKAEKPEVVQEEVKEEAVVAQRREGQTQPTSQVVVEHGSEPPTLPATTTTTTTSITPIPDGFTQASVESSQMSSTRGTADVSFPGADTAVKQLDGALTQQTVPWIEDGRISHEDPPHQSSYHKKEHSQAISTILPADKAHSNRTEERGCSPITVLEARHNAEEIPGKPHARGSSHTITTTTSWGAPLSATTNIQIEDENSPHCLQFTLHSESRVTLHASKDVIQDMQLVKQQQEQKQPQELHQTSAEKKHHEGTSDFLVSEELCKGSQDQGTEERLDKSLDISTSEKASVKSEVETSDLKHIECRQKDSSDEKMVSEAEKEIIPSDITRVEDAPEFDSTSVMFLSEDKTVPKETIAEEAKGVTPETLDNEAIAASVDDHDQAASEVTASSAHRPTTLMITSNSNESSDDAECTTNDHTRLGGENDIPQDPEQEGGMAGEEESKQEESDKKQSTTVSERLSGSESGAVPRLERSVRSSPRTTTLVKVKVEKRPVGSHSQVRDRNSHDHMTVVRTHSVEEEVRGLMQEVKEATSQIKQEVKELRQADTPTPDTPTPLREFKEFLNREEEQEQERLPTIKEICRESEEDSSAGTGGEHMRDEYSHLRLNTPVHEPSLPEQLAPSGFDDKSNPDSGYSTMEGYYAKSVDPAQTTKYSPSCCEMVPEGSFDEHSVKSELESPSSPVDVKALSPVVCSIDSAVSTVIEKQSKSKFKSFLKKVCKLTSKGGAKYEARNNDSQGELTLNRDSSEQNLKTKDYTLEDGKTSGMVKEKEGIQSQQLITENSREADPGKFVLNRYLVEEKPKSDEGNVILRPTEQFGLCSDENCVKITKDIDSPASYSSVTPDGSECPIADPPVPVVHYISTTSVKEIHCTNIQMPDIHESETIFTASSFPEDEKQVYGQMKEAQDVSPKVSQEDAGFTRYYEDLENMPPMSNFQFYDMEVQLSTPEAVAEQPMEVKDQCQEDSELLPLQTLENPVDWTLPDSSTEHQLASFSPIECLDDAIESDLQGMDYITEYESPALGVTVPDRVIDRVPVYDNTFTIPEEIEEETTSFNQQIIMITEPPPLIRKGSRIPKLSEVNKFTLSEEEYDDYIDLPDTDIVEIMETVIEVDETEESDEMHQEEKEAAHEEYIPSQEEKYRNLGDETNMAVEIWKAKRKKDQTSLCVQEEEIQLLSEADIETINESLTSSNEFTSCDSPLQMENKITSDITLLSQDHEQEYEIRLHDSSVTGEACFLEPEEVYQGETDEARKIEECTEETIKRAREITEHILKQIESMDVGNKKITDIETEGDTDFDFTSESGYKSPASKEIDSEMETSFSDDFPVTVPELDETDSWLQTIKAYQSLTSKASATCEDTPNICKYKKEKQAKKTISESDCDWLLFMKKARSISHDVAKENEADLVSKSEKVDENDIQNTTEAVEDVMRKDAMETVTCESECEPSSADCHEKDTDQHPGMAEDITQSPYKVCLYTSDGESLHQKGILEEGEKMSPTHDEATSEMVDGRKESIIHESALFQSSDNLEKMSECIDQNESMLGDDEEEPLSGSGDIMKSEVISVKQTSDFVCELSISENHLLAASEVCQEVGKASVTFHESDPCSNEVGYLTQSIVDVKDPSMQHLQESETAVNIRMEELASEDDEKSTMMSSISEELKAIISSLECTLVAGEGRHLEIGPLMKRLDEMEREMITVDFEASESSIPMSVDDLNVHCVVSTSQISTSTEEVKMPVGLEKESATLSVPGGPSPTGEMNGQDIQEALTDIEELHSEGDISPMPKRKTLLSAPKQDAGALTDTEDMDLSGEEDDILPAEKKNLPTIQALGLLPEPTKEVINLTEGFAREPSPLYGSDSETEKEDVLGRHRKNVQKVDTLNELSVPTDDVVEGLTDVEDMVASGDEEVPAEVDDSLPDYYMAQGEDVSNKEDFKVVLPTPKIFVTKKDDSSDEEDVSRKQKSKSRSLRVDAVQEGTTDVEDLDVSDKDVTREPLPQAEPVVKDKVKRKKQVRRKAPSQKPPTKTLTAPYDDASSLTDIEVLTGDENVEEEEDESNLNISKDELDEPTDSEDVEASDAEEIEDLVPKPVEKIKQPCIPEPHRERIKISDVEERAEEESGGETDEEGFELNDKEDERPLIPRKRVVHEPLDNEEKDMLDVKETDEASFTDTEDFDIEEKEEEEVIDEILNRVPEESEIYTIKEMEGSMGRVTKKEMIRDADAEIKQKIKEAEQAGITIQAALEEECLTDIEDLDATEESKKSKNKVAVKSKKKEDETDEESVNESDIEEEVSKPQKNKRRSKRLPVAPQLSEVRFVETETGPLSIVITPDSKVDTEAVEKVSGITFIESENDEGATDVEEVSEGEESSALNAATNKPEPVTDTEDLDFDPAEVDRPRSPLPPHLKYNVLQSPKRELVYIKEDKYGVPQVTVQKLQKDELFVSDIEDLGATDTEDIEVSEEEALRLAGVTTDSTSDFELIGSGNTEVASKVVHRKPAGKFDEEEGNTDVEELILSKKPRHKNKARSKLVPAPQGEDNHTDTEFLSDIEDKGKLTVRTPSPNAHTDVEDFDHSDIDVEEPERDDAPTPDIIRDAAIKKTVHLTEGPHGTTYTENATVASSKLLDVEAEPEGTTDVEDMEMSGAEDEGQVEHPLVDLPEYETSSVDISERSSVPSTRNEEKQVKDNLLLPEDNFNNITDVESLGEGEGTHEASQPTEHQTSLPEEQAASSQPTSGTKAGSDGGLHGGCPEAQGMDWEGKSVDSMLTESVMQARLSMLPAVDTNEGVALPSQPSSTSPPVASTHLSSPSSPDLPFLTTLQPQASSSQDPSGNKSQTFLHLEPSHLHDSNSFEPQGFDVSPSSATKLSDPVLLEKSFVCGAEASTASHLVASPSIASLQSESFTPFIATEELGAASVTFNTSSALISMGPVSPTENSSEDHAEIERTSTEISPDSVRFDQDILDTRTEDEAPDLDDDLIPSSPVPGQELSERVFSIEITEDTDITTPMEMRDSHTERDTSASNLIEDKEVTDGKSDLKEPLPISDKDENNAYLAQEVNDIINKVNRLQEQVKAKEIDPISARSEIKVILNTLDDVREVIEDSKVEDDSEANVVGLDILSNIDSVGEMVMQMMKELHLTDPEHSEFWSKDEAKVSHETECAVAETVATEDKSPPSANQPDQSFSDLIDSEEFNRDSLEDEFDRLTADLSSPPKSDKIEFIPKAIGATAPSNDLSFPVSSVVYPPIPPDAFQATQPESDVGVVFTERKEYGGGVKTSAETTGGHSHISPSPVLHPSQSIQSSSSTSFQQKLPCTTSVNVEDSQSSHDEPHVPSRPSRRHERTFSQATNIFTGAIPTETKVESKKVEDIKEEQIGITEDIKPYSERKQFWESVTSQSFESKSSHLLKSETESDTDTTGTDGTVLEQKVRKTKVSSTESNDSESEYLAQRVDPRFYENAGFAGTEKIDVSTESARERTISPFEVLRSEEPTDELPSPEDIAFKDVSSKRALFEKEIKRQSMEIEESQSWKRSSKEYDETLVVSEETASSTLKKKEERESKISETIEKDKEIKKKFESKKDDLSKTDFKTEITSKSDKLSSVEDRSEVTESSKLHQEKMQKKEEKVTSELGALGKKSVTQRDASTEKREKEVSEKEAKIIHEKKDSYSRTFSKSVSKSEEKTESSSEAKETVHTLSTDDQDTSKDEMTEEDITRTEETSDEEPEEKLAADKTTVDVTEESRQLGDTRETVVRETTTTREGDQEQRVVKETKTQETAMADGSTIKTTSITTFTTQLETKDQEEPKPYSAKTAKEKAEAYVKQQMKSDIFSEELSSSAEDQSPEHKVLTPKDTIAPVSREQKSHPLSSPILVPEEKIEDVVWEVSQERSETVLSETVEDIPVQQSYETQHVRDLSSDESRVLEKPQPEQATEATKHKLSEEEARKLAIEIVEEVKTEAVKRSPLVTPSQTFQEFPQEPEDTTDGATQPSLPIPIPESAFTQETTSKIEKYIQEQLGEEVDEKQLKLIESVTAKKTELLHRKLVGGQYQQSMEITDEDLRSSGAELSPIEHHMERLRQMTEEEDNQRYAREPSEADESESSIIIHDTVDDVISSEYDQATQMISKTLDSIKTADISRIERPIDTIEELPETPVMPIVEVKERKMSEVQEVARFSDSDIKETARQIVKEVTEIAKESEAVKQASQAADLKQAPGSQDQAKSCSPKSGSKPGSRKGSWMDDEDLTREFRKDYEDKKKMFKEEMTSDKSDASDAKDDGAVKVKHQKSSESQKEVPMESSMTESMEESSAVESIRSIEGKLKQEIVPEIREGETEKKHEERSSSSHEEVVMRKKTHIEEFSRRSGADFDTYSSSGESHYFTAAEGTSDSRTASRPCSSDVEALMSERTGTSEYDTALTSQDTSQYSSYSSSSREYRTAASSMSSRDSMKSIDSESSGNLASVELSEASETLVPSALELERDMDLLDQEIMEEDQSHSTQAHPSIIPQLTVQSDTPKSEGVPCAFDLESDEGESEPEVKEKEHHVASRMKRSVEMTFHPEPVPIAECKKAGVTGSVASSLEESTLSEMSVVTVVERERSLQGSFHSESSMTASAVSEQMASSSEGQPAAHPITRTDSGVLTTDTGDGDMALHSVTITATSVPSTTDSSTASMCTQVTSETRSQAELTESEQFFHANGPTEVDYVPEYDDEVRGVRPVAAPALPPVQEVSGAVAGPSEGPQKVTVVEECYETEADQEYGQMMRESEYSDMAEAELQYSLEEQPESEMSNMLGIEEPIERPKTPEPGYVPSSRPSHITAQSLDESEEFTEVDKRFSAIFSTTYEEREEGARSLVPGLSVDIPDIRVTEHTLPMPSQYCYPDLEREEDFPECQVQAEVDASGQDVPATPGSQESASTCASRKSSSTDSEQGREYCLDDAAQGLPFESFEMVEAGDIEDFLEYEKTLRMHEKRMLEMSQIQEEEEEEVEEEQKVHTSPIMPSQLKAVKLEAKSLRSSDSQSQVSDEGSEEADSTIEEQRRWLELQFEESSVSNFEYSQPPYMQHVYSGPLEDIEEEKEDAERRDLSHVVKGSSLSSTPEYDVLAGRKFFTRSGEHDDVSMSSLQEFENLERAVAVDAVARRSSSGSQESLNGRKPEGKSGQGDDISVGSFASLQEFERLEEECLEAEKIEKKAKEEEAMLSEIEEGHESQVSESESCETMSEPGQASVDGEEYDQRMFEIDEIIRQAQTNVEKFDKTKPGYEGVQLQDIVSNGSGSSRADRTPSVGREEGDADSLEEAQLPELDLDQSAPGATSTKQDVMTLSTDSIETSAKQKVPRETSQDSLEKVATRTSDPMATSVDSIDLASRHDPMTTSIDSLEGRRRGQDPMSASTDSIDPYRRDVMATSIDSLGKDDSSGRDADISSGSEQVRPLPRDGLMEWSTDSLEPTSSQATHAIYHQYDTDSVMSGSFASGCSNTLVASTEGLPDMMTSSMYLPEGELPPLEGEEQHTHYVHTSSGSAAETVAPSAEPGFSHSITRVVKLPPEAHQVTFTGPDAQKKLEEYIKGFNAGQHSVQDETVDEQGNVHIRRVTQTRIVAEPDQTQEHGFSVSEPSTVETEECDEHGNVTRVIRRTVVTSHTIEVDLDTGEPIVQPSSSTPSKSSTSASTSTFSPSISRIPRPVTSPPQSRSQQPGPPPGLRGPCEPVPPSLEPNTVSGLDVEEMSSGMEGYASDGNDPMTTTHITRYDPDPLPITTSTTTTTTTTTTTRIIRRTKEEDGEVKEEEEIFEEY